MKFWLPLVIIIFEREVLFDNPWNIKREFSKLINTFDYLEVAEFSANSLVMASSIGPLQPMGDKEIDELRIAFNVK